MSLGNRVEKLELKLGADQQLVFIVKYYSSDPGGTEARTIEEQLTQEEEKTLEEHKERLTAAAAPGEMVVIPWTAEKAREMMAQSQISGGI